MSMTFSTSALSGVIRASGLGLSLVVNVVLANLLLPDGYGLYGFIMASVAILTIPATFGMPALIVRETARSMADCNPGRVWQLWRWAQRVGVMTSIGAAAIGIPWLLFNAEVEQWRTWAWGGGLIPILVLAYIRSAAIRGLGHTLLGQFPETILRPAATVVFVLFLAVILGPRFDTEFAMIATLSGTAVAFLLGQVVLLYVAPRRPPASSRPATTEIRRTWFVAAITIGLANGAQVLGANTDILFLGVLTTNAEVGLYKIALSGGSLVGFGLQAVNMVLMPQIASIYHSGDMMALKSMVRFAAQIAFAFTLGAVAMLVVFGNWLIIALFGTAYADAYVTLLIIGSGQLASAFFGSVVLLLSMTGHERKTLVGAVGYALLNTLLNVILVPLAGMEGAAVATAASLFVLNLYLWIVARQTLGINTIAFGRL